MKLQTKILLCLLGLTLITLTAGSANLFLFRQGTAALDGATGSVLDRVGQIEHAQSLVERVQQTVLRALLSPPAAREVQLQELDEQSLEFYAGLDMLNPASRDSEQARDRLVQAFQAYYFLAVKVLTVQEGDVPLRDHRDLWDSFMVRKLGLLRQLDEHVAHHAAVAEQEIASARSSIRTMTLFSLGVAGAAVAATFLVALLIHRFLARPLGELVRAVREVGDGRLETPVQAWREDELGVLATSFDELRQRLFCREKELAEHRQELEQVVAERTTALTSANRELSHEVAERWRAECQLRGLNETLEQRVAERTRELRRSQTLEAMGRLAGGVAHDFNNLLGGVLGCLYTVRLRGGSIPAVVEELDRAQQLCKRGGQLTAQLLAVARQKGGEPELLDARRVLEELGLLLRRTLPLHIRLRLTLEGTLPVLRADRSRLHTAVLNLVLNARDAIPEGGVVTLRSWVEKRHWYIAVADTGAGVPPEIEDRVFEPFFTTKQVGAGAGLGLSLVYATAEDLGGTVEVRSPPEGGAIFTLCIPLPESTEPLVAEPLRSGAEHPLTRGRLLVVEDEECVARLMVDVLEKQGYRVLVAATGADALGLLKEHRDEVVLVLLDLVLPGMSAGSVYRLLRGVAPELGVLFTTGREDLARGLDPERPVLPKPFTDEDLLTAVAIALTNDG